MIGVLIRGTLVKATCIGEDNVKKHREYHMKMEGEIGEICL